MACSAVVGREARRGEREVDALPAFAGGGDGVRRQRGCLHLHVPIPLASNHRLAFQLVAERTQEVHGRELPRGSVETSRVRGDVRGGRLERRARQRPGTASHDGGILQQWVRVHHALGRQGSHGSSLLPRPPHPGPHHRPLRVHRAVDVQERDRLVVLAQQLEAPHPPQVEAAGLLALFAGHRVHSEDVVEDEVVREDVGVHFHEVRGPFGVGAAAHEALGNILVPPAADDTTPCPSQARLHVAVQGHPVLDVHVSVLLHAFLDDEGGNGLPREEGLKARLPPREVLLLQIRGGPERGLPEDLNLSLPVPLAVGLRVLPGAARDDLQCVQMPHGVKVCVVRAERVLHDIRELLQPHDRPEPEARDQHVLDGAGAGVAAEGVEEAEDEEQDAAVLEVRQGHGGVHDVVHVRDVDHGTLDVRHDRGHLSLRHAPRLVRRQLDQVHHHHVDDPVHRVDHLAWHVLVGAVALDDAADDRDSNVHVVHLVPVGADPELPLAVLGDGGVDVQAVVHALQLMSIQQHPEAGVQVDQEDHGLIIEDPVVLHGGAHQVAVHEEGDGKGDREADEVDPARAGYLVELVVPHQQLLSGEPVRRILEQGVHHLAHRVHVARSRSARQQRAEQLLRLLEVLEQRGHPVSAFVMPSHGLVEAEDEEEHREGDDRGHRAVEAAGLLLLLNPEVYGVAVSPHVVDHDKEDGIQDCR
mmetsp:Transcript_78790/g.170307  ORF Transcript_78790/g.170307 Transcript_78790/m.170307 type:complete len:700 (-) Transcript_78790:75-2174(-)